MDYRARMIEDMKLRDFTARTQESYLLAARQLAQHYGRPPSDLTEEEIRQYFLYLREGKKLAPASINQAYHGIRFLFLHSLGRNWPVFKLLRVKQPKKLPVVLSMQEVRALLAVIRHPVQRVALTTIYALGLRLIEARTLQKQQIDSERRLVWIREGKGRKDRGVPLPSPLLERLRSYWKTDRPASESPYLFLARDHNSPIHATTLQKTIIAARRDAGFSKPASAHTLRHSYATHLLESGVSLRTIQMVLGHKSMRTTEVYMHVTHEATERLQEILDRIMADL